MDSTPTNNPGRKRICMDPVIKPGNSSMNAPKVSYKKPENSFSKSFTRGPLKIPIKRLQSDDDKLRPPMTTTAQRISDTLASISSPASNAKKVHIWQKEHPKFVKPNFEGGGPPKVGSLFNYSNITPYHTPKKPPSNFPIQSTPISGITQPFPNFNLTSYELPNHQQNPGGGKMLHSNRIHTQAPRVIEASKVESFLPVPVRNISKEEEKTKFKFRAPWTSADVFKFIGSKKKENPVPMNTNNKQTKVVEPQTLKYLEGINKKESNVGLKTQVIKPMSTFSTALLLKPTNDISWECPVCMVKNKESSQECVCCSEKNPKFKTAATTTTKPIAKLMVEPLVQAKTKWECPVCMVSNEIAAERCVCCTEKNPNFKSAPPVPKSWECPTCMVTNKISDLKCVCCSEVNVNAPKNLNGPEKVTTETTPKFTFGFGALPSNSLNASKPPEAKKTVTFNLPDSESKGIEKKESEGFTLRDEKLPTSTTGFSFGFKMPSAPAPAQTSTFQGFGASPQNKDGSWDGLKEPSRISFGVSRPEITIKRNSFDQMQKSAFNIGREEPKNVNPKTILSFGTSPSSNMKRKFGGSDDEVPIKKSESSGTTITFKHGLPEFPTPSKSMFGGVQKPAEPQPSKFIFEPFFGGPSSTRVEPEPKPALPQFMGISSLSSTGSSISQPVSSAPSPSSFNFNPPTSEPALKLKFTEAPKPEATKINTNSAGFMEALGSKPFEIQPATTVAAAPVTPNSNIFHFGQKANTEVPKTFSFGNVVTGGGFGTGTTPATTSANNPSSPFVFSAKPGNVQPNPTLNLAPQPTAPSFSFTPNFNMGANPAIANPNSAIPPQPTLFQFNAGPSNAIGERVIKRAIRRKK